MGEEAEGGSADGPIETIPERTTDPDRGSVATSHRPGTTAPAAEPGTAPAEGVTRVHRTKPVGAGVSLGPRSGTTGDGE